MTFFATIYVEAIAPHVVSASKNGKAAFVNFSKNIPETSDKVITKLIIIK